MRAGSNMISGPVERMQRRFQTTLAARGASSRYRQRRRPPRAADRPDTIGDDTVVRRITVQGGRVDFEPLAVG